MRRLIFTVTLALLATASIEAQKPVFESATQTFGYKNDNGSWKIMPQYQRAGNFEGDVRKWAPVKTDGRWGCIDIDGNLVCRNMFPTKEAAQEAAPEAEARVSEMEDAPSFEPAAEEDAPVMDEAVSFDQENHWREDE